MPLSLAVESKSFILKCFPERIRLEMVRVLLEKGAEVDASDPSGSTPLLMATANGQATGELLRHQFSCRASDERA